MSFHGVIIDPTLRDLLASWLSIFLNLTYKNQFMKYCSIALQE